ncbi:phospholipase D-like domain-containing protein [Blastomonas aquatica]|uniref:Phospholipase D n=1 Tax=Blastomonas aquatica TaxID=1510276 RepID=A0ABQ1JED7_9SPHN|nr:phospholipase D family protein [Blastomonas aquatica]GGB64722.1 phospholipase D family protein [Blastomonas aquatica]
MNGFTVTALVLAVLSALWVTLRLVYRLPALPPEPPLPPPQDTPNSRIGRAIAGLEAAHPGLSGILPLVDSREAYAARVKLIRAADVCLDVQYYIWREDVAGLVLLEELREAADRGVKVRLLLDDNGIAKLDDELTALDSHPDIEVRLFNPFVIRTPKVVGYLLDCFRLNRRMHNKSLTADNQMTIIGGRNIGDEYFGPGDQPEFADLDVLAIGAIVPEMATDFARYWTSASSYPAPLILPPAKPGALEDLARKTQKLGNTSELAKAYATAVDTQSYADPLTHDEIEYEWAPVTMMSDDPAKALGHEPRAPEPVEEIGAIMRKARKQLGLVSAYFVPSKTGARMFEKITARGVSVDVLTNALSTTDVAVVHAGYARYRRQLLHAGVRLWEMKGDAPRHPSARSGVLGSLPRSSRSSLHAKTFTIDGRRLFVGSFNFDPRSMHLNTELGFLMESPSLAQRLQHLFSEPLEHRAYRVQLAPDGAMQWLDVRPEGTVIHTHDPGTTLLRRAQVVFWQMLPIEWLL